MFHAAYLSYVQSLGIKVGGTLWKTLRSTNPIENLNGGVAQFTRNVRRWRDGSMILRWIDYPEATSTPRFMTMRSEMSLSVLSK